MTDQTPAAPGPDEAQPDDFPDGFPDDIDLDEDDYDTENEDDQVADRRTKEDAFYAGADPDTGEVLG